ncbi:MAG TPA: ribbon-helix-helix protein, CopG family [Longimicrobium sp.]|jgi:predicted transcriptional regulator
MGAPLTIRLDDALERTLDEYCRESGQNRSDVVRDALRRQLTILRVRQLRREMMADAAAQGYLTDEDVFRDVS